jgi:hypothetical protein
LAALNKICFVFFALQECSFGPLPYLVNVNVDYASKSVIATAIFGVDTQKSVFYDRHRGCGLLNAHELAHGHKGKINVPRVETPADEEWPAGNKVETVKNPKLQGLSLSEPHQKLIFIRI